MFSFLNNILNKKTKRKKTKRRRTKRRNTTRTIKGGYKRSKDKATGKKEDLERAKQTKKKNIGKGADSDKRRLTKILMYNRKNKTAKCRQKYEQCMEQSRHSS